MLTTILLWVSIFLNIILALLIMSESSKLVKTKKLLKQQSLILEMLTSGIEYSVKVVNSMGAVMEKSKEHIKKYADNSEGENIVSEIDEIILPLNAARKEAYEAYEDFQLKIKNEEA